MLFGSGNALWVTKLRIDSVHVLTEKIPPGGGEGDSLTFAL